MKKVIAILTISIITLAIGFTVAYHNTSALGYDNQYIVEVNDDSITLFNYNVKYSTIKNGFIKFTKSMPSNNFNM